MYKLRAITGIIILIFITASCGKKGGGGGGVSQTTGWEYNNPEMGGFEVASAREQITAPGTVLIEGGTFTMGSNFENLTYEWDNIPRRVTVRSHGAAWSAAGPKQSGWARLSAK